MGVHVDSLDPLSCNHDGKLLPHRLLGMGALQLAAAAKHDAGDGGSACFQEISTAGHRKFLPVRRPGLFRQAMLILLEFRRERRTARLQPA
jgi:hypothetical protein